MWPLEQKGHFLQPGSGCQRASLPSAKTNLREFVMWFASLTALVLGGLWAWWTVHKTSSLDDTTAPRPSQLARLEQRFLHVRDATMRLNEPRFNAKNCTNSNNSLAQLNRIKEGVQLLLDALERNMERHPECTPEEARLLERQLADTSKVLRDVLDLERHPQQPQILDSQTESHRRKSVQIHRYQSNTTI